MKNLYFYLIVLFLLPVYGFSQGEGQNWFFGYNAGLDFTGGNPVAMTNGAVSQWEGVASISDANGNLLFYTNGQNVWNRNHVVMTNGSGLLGHQSSSQSAVIVPYPYYPNRYYIFTVDQLAGSNGVRYSIVDMSLSGGLGAVTSTKNMPLMTNATEKITAVRHSNNSDIWVICHKWNSNQFQAFLVDACNGLNTTPVISNTGTVHNHTSGGYNTGSIGYMKASPQGNKLGLALFTQSSPSATNFELFDFNNSTGVVSNPISLPSPSTTALPPGIPWYRAYGVEFSPDGTYFYGGLNSTGEVFQYDLLAGGSTAIRNSATLVGTATGSNVNIIGALQLGTDGRIYVARDGQSYLAHITNPNTSGAFLTNNGVYLGGSTSGLGLPTFIQSFFLDLPDIYIGYSGNDCEGNSISFGLQGTDVPMVTSVDWDFGDGTTINNSSGSGVVSHTYNSGGTYYVQATYYFGCYYVVLGGNITVYSNPSVNANTSGNYCLTGNSVALSGSPSGGSWSGPGEIGNVFYPNIAGVGTHTLTYTYTNSNGCSGTDNTTVTVNSAPEANITTSTSSTCLAGGTISLTATNGGGTWSGPGVSGSSFNPSSAGVGTHTITYTTSSNGCTDSDTHSITVTNTADATISNISNLCQNESAITLNAANGGGTWTGPGVSGSTFDPSVAGVGTHTISYVISGACGDSDTETVTVYAAPNSNFISGGPYCTADNAVTLTPSVAGGTFSGPGVSGNTFDPAIAGVGSHTIQYAITNSNNCTETTQQTIVVNNTPDATITSGNAICSADAPLTLTGTSTGGVWSGAGVSGNTFDPSSVGAGTYTVNHTVNVGSCSASNSYTITVTQSQDPTILSQGPYCPSGDTVTLSAATSGGVWSGTGIIDGNAGLFDPTIGNGIYTITYTISGICGGTDTQDIEVTTTACDNDNDGVLDVDDPDDDNDGILDVDEDINGDGDYTNDDTDGDGIPNVFDLDSDNDGIVDVIEGGGEDPDGDGVIGTGPITDVDNDGLADDVDPSQGGTPLPNPDTDGDGMDNVIDIDSDDDGIVDNVEGQASDGYIAPVGTDTDNDGIDDAYDIHNGGVAIDPEDTDGDNEDDYVDTDADNDLVNDVDESNNPYVAPTGNDSDGDGLDDAFDVDGTSSTDNGGPTNDGTVPNDFTNDANPSTPQLDWREPLDNDNDGVVDAEDPDDDNDGILDVDEDANLDGDNNPATNPSDTDGDGIPDYFDLDSDNDGIVDVIEGGGEDPDGDGIIGAGPITDIDNDGLADVVDPSEGGTPLPNPDTDNDGINDFLDLDADDDGIVDNIESQSTFDYIAPIGNDTDGDGIDDAYDLDNGGMPIAPLDTDGDENPDYTDLNADNDNEDDLIEGWDIDNDDIPDTEPTGNDSDNDGIDDAFDVDGTSSVNNGGPTNGGSLPTDFPNLDDSASDELDWREVETYVEVPNIFTPNGDGINDVFTINSSNIESLNAVIVNRWGQTVFEWKGVNGKWDGHTKSSQEASEGTYYYIITGKDNTGEVFEYKGSLILER